MSRPSRVFRLFVKKRGDRRTVSRLAGGLGEALFFVALFLIGCASLAILTTSQLPVDDILVQPITGWTYYLLLFVVGTFLVMGSGGLIYTVFHIGTSAERRASLAERATKIDILSDAKEPPETYPTIPHDDNLTNSPGIELAYRLPIESTSRWWLLTSTLFTLVWNGLVVVLAVVALGGFFRGETDWRLVAFLVPFTAAGGWSIYYFLRQLLITTGIGPTTIEISDHPLYPGQRYEILLSQSGHLSVRWLEMNLVCEEEATYRQGTDVRRETVQVYQQPVFHRVGFDIETEAPFQNRCELEIPRGVMHSFQSGHNAVYWKLTVRGDVVGWPPFQRNFPIIVYPPATSAEESR